jgi:ribosomal protein S18 acetylase RimI-like enzyme
MNEQFEIIEENQEMLPEYEKISIAFQVTSRLRFDPIGRGFGGVRLVEEGIAPYIKDYDSISDEKPSSWAKRFDLSNWGILSAFDGTKRVAGAAIAWNTPGVNMLDGRTDLACLWDIRVEPEYRGTGIGRQLFGRALEWARQRQCRQIKIETQNINVPACRFYVRQGCEIGAINRYAYPEIVSEIQLIWYRNV